MAHEQKMSNCTDEIYEALCENVEAEVEQYLSALELSDLELTIKTQDFIDKVLDLNPNSTIEHDTLEPAIRKVLHQVREATIFANF